MAGILTEWPSKRGPITKIMQSDGCKGDQDPLAVGRWYEFQEFGCHLGNLGLGAVGTLTVTTQHHLKGAALADRSEINFLPWACGY